VKASRPDRGRRAGTGLVGCRPPARTRAGGGRACTGPPGPVAGRGRRSRDRVRRRMVVHRRKTRSTTASANTLHVAGGYGATGPGVEARPAPSAGAESRGHAGQGTGAACRVVEGEDQAVRPRITPRMPRRPRTAQRRARAPGKAGPGCQKDGVSKPVPPPRRYLRPRCRGRDPPTPPTRLGPGIEVGKRRLTDPPPLRRRPWAGRFGRPSVIPRLTL